MGKIVIFRNGSAHLNLVERGKVTINDATFNRAMLSDDSVNLKVNSSSVLDIKVNDYFTLFGENYRINQLPTFTKNSNSSYEYQIVAQGLMYDLLRCKFFNADGEGFKTTLDFPLIGNLELFLTVIANNMKRFSDKWEFKSYPFQKGETKTLTFGSDTCLSALQKICQEFKTDFWVKSENGKFVIHTGDFGKTIPVTFEYGKGNGLYALSRSNVNEEGVINRMYVEGSSENLPNNYRNFSDRLKFSDAGYLQDANLIAEMGLKEGELKLDDIYPSRTGKVTSLGATKFKFIDDTMDFDLNEKEADGITTKYLKPDTTAKIHFNTGNLAGYEFEIKKGGYKQATKEFEIIPITTTSGQKIPDLTSEAFQFGVGDEYVLIDIYAPEIYITNAENKLLAKATEQFALKKQVKVSYDLIVDPEYIKNLQTKINVGDYVRVKDAKLGVDKVIRVNSIAQNFIKGGEWRENDYKISIADSYEISYASQMILDIREIKNVNNITNQGEINYSLIGMKNTRELQSMVFDTDGYFDPVNIKPHSIETNMLTVGSQSQQLSCSVVFRVNADGLKNKIVSEAGKLFSQTFNKTWDIPALIFNVPDDVARYVYAKCSKTGSAGEIFYTQSQIKFDENPNDYYFLVGVLHSVVEGMRVLSITIGTTTINGGLVRTGIISSLDGQTTFNLNTGEFKGKFTFANGTNVQNAVENAQNAADSSLEAVNNIQIGGRNLLLKSDEFKENGGYPTATYYLAPNDYKNGEKYTITIWGNLGAGKTVFAIYNTGGAVDLCALNKVEDGKYQAVFDWTNERNGIVVENIHINVYPFEAGVNAVSTISKIKLEKGNKGTDWTPAPEDVSAEIQDVRDYLNDFEDEINTTFSDGLISQAEAISIEKYINQLEKEKADVVNKFNQVFSNPNLVGTPKSNLQTAYLGFTNSHSDLINVINEAISDGKTTQSEKADVDEFFIYYKNSVATLTTRFEEAQKSIETTSIQNIQIGGRNLLLKSDKAERKVWWINFELAEKIVGDYVLQIWCSDTIENGGGIGFGSASGFDGSYFHYPTLKNGYQEIQLKNLNSGNNTHLNVYANDMTKIDKIKLEKGTKATDWTPAPEDVANDINNIQIGGRNLFRGALFLNGSDFPANSIRDIGKISGFNGGQFNAYQFLPITMPLVANQQYTASLEVRINNNAASVEAGIYFEYPSNTRIINVGIIAPNVWKRLEFTSDKIVNPSAGILAIMSGVGNPTTTIEYRNFKFERGSRATDWTPAPEDVQSQIDTANQSSANALAQAQNAYNTAQATASVTNFLQTTIDGNVVSTGTLQVGDVVGANAFISGVTDKPNGESIRFGAGKPYTQKQNSPFQVLDNGMVRFVNPLTGQRVFELGFNQAISKVVFDIFGENGVKIVTIGQKGIEFLGYISDGFTQVGFTKLSTTSFVKATMEAELKTLLKKRVVSNSPRTYQVTQPPNVQTYYYDAGRNFETVSNEIYIGYHYDMNKFSGFIQDGIYVGIPDNPLFLDVGESFVSFYSVAHKIQNGKVVDSMGITAEGLISEINN